MTSIFIILHVHILDKEFQAPSSTKILSLCHEIISILPLIPYNIFFKLTNIHINQCILVYIRPLQFFKICIRVYLSQTDNICWGAISKIRPHHHFFFFKEMKGTKGSLMATQYSFLKKRNSIWLSLGKRTKLSVREKHT